MRNKDPIEKVDTTIGRLPMDLIAVSHRLRSLELKIIKIEQELVEPKPDTVQESSA